VEFYNRILY